MKKQIEVLRELNLFLEKKSLDYDDAEISQWVHDVDWLIKEFVQCELDHSAELDDAYASGCVEGRGDVY